MGAELTGIAWDHGRAFPPLVATAQRFEELNPGTRIRWEKRSLHEFGHANVDALAARFDLVVVDHPWMGYAAAHGSLVDLRRTLDRAYLVDLETNTVGASYESYVWNGELLAAPIDAAAPSAAARLDLLEALGVAPPADWDDVLGLAHRGRVILPTFPPDLLLHLLMLCASHEPKLLVDDAAFGPRDLVLEQMERLRELVLLTPEACDRLNPIQIFEWLARDDDVAYCPFAYAYNNYARAGYGTHRVTFYDLPRLSRDVPLRSVLGGTGLAISSSCRNAELATRFLTFCASGETQRTLYTATGGQPAHRAAWRDPDNDRLTAGFFHAVLPAIERAWTRPRYYGYPYFQASAGIPLQAWIRGGGSAAACLEAMNGVYRRSRTLRTPDPVPTV